MSRGRVWAWSWLLLGTGATLSACNSNGVTSDSMTSVTSVVSTTVPSGTIDLATVPPVATTGSAADQLDWYLNVLNGTAELDESSYQQRFSTELRDELPFDVFTGLTNQFSTVAPVSVASTRNVPTLEIDPDSTSVEVIEATVVSNSGSGFQIEIGVNTEGRVSFIDVESDENPTLPAEPPNLTDAANDAAAFGDFRWASSTINLDVTSLDAVSCTLTEGDRADEATGVGTASAVWVLGALADAIASGDLEWDTELTISSENKSLDPGVLHERPDLTPIEVGQAAKLMFELTDNTAFDLLVEAVGRDKVEQAQARWGNTHADLNSPFLSTREMLVLKTSTTAVQDGYLAATPQQRRDMLPDLTSVRADDIPIDIFLQGPVRPSELNWFASPNDLCTALARLMWAGTNLDNMDPLVDIITSNHGVLADAQWDEVAYKGGAEPGMLTTAWVMATDVESAEGTTEREWFSYVGNLVNPDEDFAEAEPTLLLAAGRDLTGPQDRRPPTDDGASEANDDEANDDASGANLSVDLGGNPEGSIVDRPE